MLLVVAVAKDLPFSPSHGPVALLGHADSEPPHPPGQRGSIRRLNDEMHVVVHDRVVNNAKPALIARANEDIAEGPVLVEPPQPRGPLVHANGDVQRPGTGKPFAPQVGHPARL